MSEQEQENKAAEPAEPAEQELTPQQKAEQGLDLTDADVAALEAPQPTTPETPVQEPGDAAKADTAAPDAAEVVPVEPAPTSSASSSSSSFTVSGGTAPTDTPASIVDRITADLAKLRAFVTGGGAL